MTFNLNFLGIGKRKTVETPPVVEVAVEEPVTPKVPKTAEGVMQAKKEIEDLVEQKQALLQDLRDRKSQAAALGVQEFSNKEGSRKRTETFNDLVNQTEEDLMEIRKKIVQKKEEFDLQPKQVEVLEARRKTVDEAVERIKNNMAPEYRAISTAIKNYLGEEDRRYDTQALNLLREHILEKNLNIPEVSELYEAVKDLRFYEQPDLEQFKKLFRVFKDKIEAQIKERTLYKTPAEEKEAYQEINRGVRLSDEISSLLKDAQHKEGKFEPKNPNYF